MLDAALAPEKVSGARCSAAVAAMIDRPMIIPTPVLLFLTDERFLKPQMSCPSGLRSRYLSLRTLGRARDSRLVLLRKHNWTFMKGQHDRSLNDDMTESRTTLVEASGAGILVLLIAGGLGCSRDAASLQEVLEPPPVQQAVVVERLLVDGSVQRESATRLETRLITLPRDETDTEASQLLGDGTVYRLELDALGTAGAALLRFDDVTGAAPAPVRIPLRAAPGQTIRTEDGRFRVESSTPGLLMGREGRGTVWWEEGGPKGRLIEFRVDGDHAVMIPPAGPLDDPATPAARRFNLTPDRELPYRFTTGAVAIGRDIPHAFLGGRGFSLALARAGSGAAEAWVEAPAVDLPRVDVAAPAPGTLRVTIGYITARGHVVQVTYDSAARAWRDHRPLVTFPEAQIVEVADVGPAGVLANLILPWNGTGLDPETGLYWIRHDLPVRHLLQRIRNLRTATLPDGFVALFEDEFSWDRAPTDPQDVFVLRAQGDRLGLFRFPRPGLASSSHFVWLGGHRLLALFSATEAVAFELPDLRATDATSGRR